MTTKSIVTKLCTLTLLTLVLYSCEVEPVTSDVNPTEQATEESTSNEQEQPAENGEQNNEDPAEEPTSPSEEPLMSATIGGVRYDVMKPFGYPFTQGVKVSSYFDEERTLDIQGFAGNIDGNYVQIEFRIKEQFWSEGTFDLVGGDLDDTVGVYLIIADGVGDDGGAIDYEGTFSITSFDRENRRIQGTFSFPYLYALNNATEYETRQVTEGSFDYPLDDEEFDN